MIRRSLLVALAALVMGVTAQASPVPGAQLNGTLGFIPDGSELVYSPSNGLLSSATTVTFSDDNVINSLPSLYLGHANDFHSGGAAPQVKFSNVIFSPGTVPVGTGAFVQAGFFTFDSGRFSFDATSEIAARNTSGQNSSLTLYFSGVLNDLNGDFASSPASLTISLNQTGGSTGSSNYSGTFSTPPDTPPVIGTPEPSTFAIAALGVLGSVVVARRRNKVVA